MNYQDVFNLAIGIVTVISVITSVIYYCRIYLPGIQMKALDDFFGDAKGLYNKVEADWLLPEGSGKRAELNDMMSTLELKITTLRHQAYMATTIYEDITTLFRYGLPRHINHGMHDVKRFRARVMLLTLKNKSASEKERERRRRQQTAAQNQNTGSATLAVAGIVFFRQYQDHGLALLQWTAQACRSMQFSTVLRIRRLPLKDVQSIPEENPCSQSCICVGYTC
ncbi:hypothetical protein BDQ17DRAFT_1330922 [Cyathus striatus]|nr:hypothetical protein BDQ17DRAFT_1330922 [Cyathus striatus]